MTLPETTPENEPSPPPERFRKAVIAQRMLLGLFVGFPVFGMVAFCLVGDSWNIFMLVYAAVYFAAGIYMMGVQCPNCGQAYFKGRFGIWHPGTSSCRSCGAP
jgi:hypothetical protein